MSNHLLEVFSEMKNAIYKHNLQPYNMEPVFERFKSENTSQKDKEYLQTICIYASCMKTSLEAIGTKIIELQRFVDYVNSGNVKSFDASQKKFEDILTNMFILIDNYIDSITAFSRAYQIKGQEYDFIGSIMRLRSKRDLLMKIGSEYMSKMIKGLNDNNELRFFLGDFLDSLIGEAHRLQITKLLKLCNPIINQDKVDIEELW